MEINQLIEWNPWWENKAAINELRGKVRPFYKFLVDSVNLKEVTIITGVRRSGKSTLMYQMIDELLKKGIDPAQILFVNLEDKKLIKNSLDDIYTAYRKEVNLDKKAYIFFDEIHAKKAWEAWIKKKYDLKSNDKFIISGSCSYLLKKEYSTLLTGRNLTFEVFPLGFEEFLLFKGIEINKKNIKKSLVLDKTKLRFLKLLKEYINLGGFPEIFFKPKNFKMKVLKQYFDDILYKDIIDRYNLNTQKTKDLALFLTTNFTSFISLRNLRNVLKISYDTIKEYLSHFKEAFLFFALEYFSYSLKEQKAQPSKIYCIDNGLRNAVSFKFSKDEGKLAENLVFVELKRREKDVYYWKKKFEVDFVVKNNDNSLTAINVSNTDIIDEREINGLLEFKKSFKRIKELLILTNDTEKKEKGIKYIPVWKWLLSE
ncbi:ATP-binding protein [Candidatus Woesearchaeota archaeon]|nr:MAG: ATP-binding protein [Candidatus Woesearchaeota archaeon]